MFFGFHFTYCARSIVLASVASADTDREFGLLELTVLSCEIDGTFAFVAVGVCLKAAAAV